MTGRIDRARLGRALPLLIGLAVLALAAVLVATILAVTGWDLETLVIVVSVPGVAIAFLLMAAQDIGAIVIETIASRSGRRR